MCHLPSGWIDLDTYEIHVYDGYSHSLAQEKLGLKIERLREWEWPLGKRLTVRVHQDGPTAEDRLKNHLLKRFKDRAGMRSMS